MLYHSGNIGTKQQAHNNTELMSRLDELETQQDQSITNMNQLHNNQEIIVANIHGGASVAGTQVPAGISTSGASTVGASDSIARAVREQLAYALKNLKLAHNTPSTQNSEVATWMQLKYWCWSYGVNLTHATARHTSEKKEDGHDDHLSPTKTNPQYGGVSSRNRLWMKWCHSVTKKIHGRHGE